MFTEWNFTRRNQNFGPNFEIIWKVNIKKVWTNQNRSRADEQAKKGPKISLEAETLQRFA